MSTYFAIIRFAFGLAIGSFLNVLIDRLPNGLTLWGRSRCDHCKKTLRWFELVPVFSWIVQQGRCRRCRAPVSFQYPLIELFTGFGFALPYFMYTPLFLGLPHVSSSLSALLSYYLIFSSLLVILVADVKYHIIPDSMVLTLIAGTVLWHTRVATQSLSSLFTSYVFSAVISFLFFFLLWFITRGAGMGFGDVKLSFALGLLLGYPYSVIAFYLAFLTGAVYGVILILLRQAKLKSAVAFGPFLILGTVLALFFSDSILGWWRQIV